MKEVEKIITRFEVLDGPHFDKKENCEIYEVIAVVMPKDITITTTMTIEDLSYERN